MLLSIQVDSLLVIHLACLGSHYEGVMSQQTRAHRQMILCKNGVSVLTAKAVSPEQLANAAILF